MSTETLAPGGFDYAAREGRLRVVTRIGVALTIFDTLATAMAVMMLGAREANPFLAEVESRLGTEGMLALRCAVGTSMLVVMYRLATRPRKRRARHQAAFWLYFVAVVLGLLACYHVAGLAYSIVHYQPGLG